MQARIFFRLVVILLLMSVGCSPVSKRALTKKFKEVEASLHDHTGFMLYDLEAKKELYSYQANQYFTPASNTKVFTLYTGLTLLSDSVPALQYHAQGDSLFFRGTGDPSFLYEEVWPSDKVFRFLKQSNKTLFLVQNNFFTQPLGPGWAWDDYNEAYSAERSALPMYGNYFSVQVNGRNLKFSPAYFANRLTVHDSLKEAAVVRDLGSNNVSFYPGTSRMSNEVWQIPFRNSPELIATLLSDTLNKSVAVSSLPVNYSMKTLYSLPADSLYKVMMQKSDNFIAEQLLLLCSQTLCDSLNPKVAIDHMKKNFLSDLPDEPLWVDGSGLSRYNLFTPRSLVKLWEKIYYKVPRERLFPLLAIGGRAGTIKNYFKNDPPDTTPYIYGKTGTLSNNHSLSGYIVTKKGRTLIFSFMSSNFATPVKSVRKEMETILKNIYLHY